MSKDAKLLAATMMAGLVVLVALAWGAPRAESRATLPGTVVVEKRVFTISNGQVKTLTARCGRGTRVFSGGYASTGQHARVFVAGPSRGENGYILSAVSPPVSINTGVGRETARITVVAWCAVSGQPVVLPRGS